MKRNHRKLLQIAKDLYQLQGQTMYDFQEKILLDENPNTIFNKSRQVGVSDTYGCRSFLRAYIYNYPILIVSPSQRQSTHFMNYVKKYKVLYETKTGLKIPLAKDAEQTLIFEEGGEIYSLPNQANTVRGFPADEIILDELAHFLHGTDRAVLQAIEPSLSRGGYLTAISTPFGTENEYYTMWDSKDLYTDFNRVLIHWTQCPDVDKDRINQIKLRDPLTYAQEYDNKFIEDVDEAEFPFSLIKKCINMELEFEELSNRKTYVGGVDIGRKHDLTASVFNERVDNKFVTRHINTMHNTKYKEQKAYYQFLLKNFVFEYIKMDATGLGNNLVEDLKDDFPDIVIPIEFDNQKKQDMVMNLKELMFNGELQFPNDASLINNIRSIKRKFTVGGYLKFDSDHSSDIGHCYDSSTEILTINGWKPFFELAYGDQVATLSKDGFLEYQFPTEIIKQEYKGNMIRIENKQIDLLVTPNHKLWVRKTNENNFDFMLADNLHCGVRYEFKKDAEWDGYTPKKFIIESLTWKSKEDYKIPIKTWVKFMGYFLSEGFTSTNIRVGITQKENTETWDNIKQVCDAMPFKWHEEKAANSMSYRTKNKSLHTYLSKFGKCYEKYIPYEIKELDTELLKIFFDAIMEGDGSRTSTAWSYYTTSERLANDMQEIVLKIGYCGNIRKIIEFRYGSKNIRPLYILNINRKRLTPQINKRKTSIEHTTYEGNIWCCNVPNHIIYVRRNGKPCWCGNSDLFWALALSVFGESGGTTFFDLA